MKLKTIADIVDLRGKTVLARVAYDIDTLQEGNGYRVSDTGRIEATLPTLRALIDAQCKVTLLTWVKRPEGKVVPALRTRAHATALAALLGRPVDAIDDCVGQDVERRVA